MKRVLFIWMFLVMATMNVDAAAPKGGINGQVLESGSRIPLPGATIKVIGSSRGAFTRNDGSFTLLDLPEEKLQLVVSSIGYITDTVEIQVSESTPYQSILLSPESIGKGTVTVIGELGKGQARALNQQRSGANVTNIVSADQIGRFPDQNVGDAMKRIPGIAVQYDQGEARFGLIRGTPSQLNSVTINGERIPSAEAENRSVQLDLIPSDMVRAIEVNKTLTPDMDADAIGGSVNLVTRDAATGDRVSATLGSGYNFLSEKPMVIGSVIGSTRLLDDKLGLILSGSYYDHILGSDNIEAAWAEGDNGVWMEEFEVRTYEVRRIRRSLSAGLDYRFNADNVIRLSGIYNSRDDWENRYRLRYIFEEDSDQTEIRRQTKGGISGDPVGDTRLEDQRTYNFTLSGEHVIADAVRLTWHGTMAKASEERPNERYIQFRTKDATTSVDISDPRQPLVTVQDGSDLSTYGLHELTEQYGYTEDNDVNGRFDLSFNWLEGEFGNVVKAGGRIRTKSKERNNNFFEYEPVGENGAFDAMSDQPLLDKTKSDFLAGPYQAGQYVDDNALGSYNLNDPNQFDASDLPEEYMPGNFNATENIYGGYVMIDQNLGDKLQAIIGVRVESTNNDYTGYSYDIESETATPITNSSSYLNVLPGINLRYALDQDLILRAAWTNTIARPNYFDLVPYRIVNIEDSELDEGNPDLKATTSMNIDLMGEYYMEPIGILSLGFFQKSLSNFIFTYVNENYDDPVLGQEFDEYRQPRNGASASILGVEFAFQRQLDFLPGALSGIGIYANYTYSSSSVDGLPGREGEDLPLAGNPNHSFNASISWEWAGIQLRVAANYTSDYIDEYGDDAFSDRYYDTQLFVDANASYAITSKLRIFVDANNLTNQPLRYYQGIPDRVAQSEFYNARFQAGVKYDL